MYVCIYIYIDINIHIYIYIFIYMATYISNVDSDMSAVSPETFWTVSNHRHRHWFSKAVLHTGRRAPFRHGAILVATAPPLLPGPATAAFQSASFADHRHWLQWTWSTGAGVATPVGGNELGKRKWPEKLKECPRKQQSLRNNSKILPRSILNGTKLDLKSTKGDQKSTLETPWRSQSKWGPKKDHCWSPAGKQKRSKNT